MGALVDEDALAQRVLALLAESLLGATAKASRPEPAPQPPAISKATPAEPAKSISAFCRSKGMSRGFYYGLKRRGLAPKVDEIIVPGEPGVNRGRGSKLIRITAESERAWDERMAQLRAGEVAQLEVARAHEQRVEAGKLAAQSAEHVSRRGDPARRRRRRSAL
jgi:hypothetical protein